MKFVKTPITLAILLSTSMVAAQAQPTPLTNQTAEEAVEVITVNAGYRSQSLQTTAASLSVLSSEDIKARHAQNLEEIAGAVANVNFSSGSQRARYYQIRGIGERSQFQEPINPSVGLIVDDIDFSGIGSVASTFDMSQVEIFRGPQGTRFGANALAGLIYMSSNAPTESFESGLKLTAGNYGSFGAGLFFSGPASDKVNYRLSAEKYQSDGFVENIFLDRDDTNNRDELTLRGKLAIEASEHLKIDLALLHFNFNNGYDAFSLDKNRQTLSDQPGVDAQETTALSAKFTYSKFNSFDLVSVISHADSDLAYGYDEDWSYEGLCTNSACEGWEYSSVDNYLRDRKTSTAEVRLISKPEQNIFSDTTSWIAGVYFKDDVEDLKRQYTYLDSDFNSAFDAKTLAVFAQFDTAINDKVTLTSGVRVENRESDYVNSNSLAFSPDDTMVGGKLALAYQVSESDMAYISVNRGFKAGSVNTGGSVPEELRVFDPEYLWNYELGYKASFLNNKAYLRTALFYMNREDIQISSYHLDTRSDGSAEFISYWDNAAKGSNQGLEIEGAWNVNDNLEVYGGLGLLSSEFKDFTYADGTKETGRDQAHAPNYQFNLGINYFPNEQWHFNLAIDGKDEFYFSDSHDQKSDEVVLVHGSISYLQDQWQLKLWVRNLLDEDYTTRGFYFGNDPRDYYTAKAYNQFAEPAVVGLTLDYQF
ncbi:MAG: TonB-dependent receptor [Thalassotalea sp.]|nr:TonB-dependent receptor [Thalassotalea sp.]